MQTAFLNWLVADLPIFGFHAQNWMLVLIMFGLFYLCAVLFLRPRREKRSN
jgi:hypothetical protein